MSEAAGSGDGNDIAPPPEARGQRPLALIFTALIVIGALAGFIGAPEQIQGYRPEASFFESPAFIPRLALALMAVCAIIHVVRVAGGASLDAGEDLDDSTSNRSTVIAGMVMFALYILLVPISGYGFTTFGFALAAGVVASIGMRRSFILALSLAALSVIVFVVALRVWFPPAAILQKLM